MIQVPLIQKNVDVNLSNILTPTVDSGVFQDLLRIPGNSSPVILFKLGSTQGIGDNGNWASGQTYFKGDYRTYPTGSTWTWKCIEDHVSDASNAPISPLLVLGSKWIRDLAPEMIQRASSGKYYRTTLQMPVLCPESGWSKYKTAEYGTFSPSRFNFPAAQKNYNSNGVYFTVSGSFTLPTAVGQSKSLTMDAGRTIPDSEVLGTCSNTFILPTTQEPVFLNLTLPTGKTLSAGDTVTLYGNSTNMVVLVICRYNSTTGATYVFSTMWGGSGTFSSWTVKKEKLHLFFRGADVTKYFFGALQTYNSTTGAATYITISFLGSATASDFFGEPAKTPLDPSSSQERSFNRSIAPLGCFFTGSFYGTGHGHVSNLDNRGTGVRYVYVGGPLIDSPPDDVIIDLYAASSDHGSSVTFDDLKDVSGLQSEGTVSNPHQFIAVSVTSQTGASANTFFWVDASSNSSNSLAVDSYWNFDLFTRDQAYGILGFAGTPQEAYELINIYKDFDFPSDDFETWPYHGDHTENNLVYSCVVDGVTIDTTTLKLAENKYLYQYRPFTSMVLSQSGTMIAPARPGAYITYSSIHTLNRYGLEFYFNQTTNRKLLVDQGYGGFFELSDQCFRSGIDYIISDNGEKVYCPTVLDAPQELTNTFAGQSGYVAVMAGGHAIGELFITKDAIWRMDAANRGQHEIEHRSPAQSGGGTKLRIRNYFNTFIEADVNIIYHSKLYVGHQ